MSRFNATNEARKLDAYAMEHGAEIEAIVVGLTERGVDPSALDELVRDAADKVPPSASDWASNLNNDGLARQVAFVLQENGIAEGRKSLEEAASEWLAANASHRP